MKKTLFWKMSVVFAVILIWGIDITHALSDNGSCTVSATVVGAGPFEISGQVTIQARSNHAEQIIFELRQPGQTEAVDVFLTLTGSGGDYTLYTSDHISAGTYDLAAKGPNTLRAVNRNIELVGGQVTSGVDFYLLGGDANNDNSVGTADLTILKLAWLSNPSSPNWDERVDFNNDGSIGTADLTVLQSNWLCIGED